MAESASFQRGSPGGESYDVAGGHCAEQGVGDGVEQRVAVGVAGEALGVVERHAAHAQRHTGLELMRVIAKTDAYVCLCHVLCQPLAEASIPGKPSRKG